MCSPRPLVIASTSCESHSRPRNANGAMSAPALTPVTTSYWGRSSRWPSPISAPAPKAPAAPPPERARKRTTPSFDAFFSPCRAASDLASTVARSTLRKRTVPGNPTGAAELKRVGGASRRGSVHPSTADTPSTHTQRTILAYEHALNRIRTVTIPSKLKSWRRVAAADRPQAGFLREANPRAHVLIRSRGVRPRVGG